MMNMEMNTAQAIEHEVVNIIAAVRPVPKERLTKVRDLTKLGFDILDVVDIILRLEKTFNLIIPDEVPVYSVDDFVGYIYRKHAEATGAEA